MTDVTKLTPRQLEALATTLAKGSPWGNRGVRSNAGGAFRRMIEDLQRQGFLGKNSDNDHAVTVKGLIGLQDNVHRKPVSAIVDAGAISQAIVLRQKFETARAEERARVETERQEAAQQRAATDRANRIGRYRIALRELGERHSIRELVMFANTDDDDVILDFGDTIVNGELHR